MLSARNARFALSVVDATPLSGFAAGVPFASLELLADVPLLAVGGMVASFAGLSFSFFPVAPATGWSDCGMLLELVEFIAVSAEPNEPRARTFSPTCSARLP